VAASTMRSLAGISRAARARVTVPSALDDPVGFTETLATYVAAHRIAVVIPTTEAAALALLGSRERLAPATLPMPDLATFRAISDKAALLERAAVAGIAVPPQCEAPDPGTARRLAGDLIYPIVLKPSRSVAEHQGVRVKLGVRHAADRSQLEAHLAQLPPAAYPLLLQQRIVGPGIGVFLLRWDDDTIATFTHRRIREKPPSGGVSVYAESTAPDAALVGRAEQLLRGCGWRGVAMVELKVDGRTGTPYLMEINGRFWGRCNWRSMPVSIFPRSSSRVCWVAMSAAPIGGRSASEGGGFGVTSTISSPGCGARMRCSLCHRTRRVAPASPGISSRRPSGARGIRSFGGLTLCHFSSRACDG